MIGSRLGPDEITAKPANAKLTADCKVKALIVFRQPTLPALDGERFLFQVPDSAG